MRGFTLIELLTVMVVLAVLAAVAMPRLIDRGALQERGAQLQLRGMLVHARQLAVAQQRDVCVLVAPLQASAVYTAAGVCEAAYPVSSPGGLGAYVMPAPTGIALGGVSSIRFNSRGQPTAGTHQTVTIGSLSVTVQQETGLAD